MTRDHLLRGVGVFVGGIAGHEVVRAVQLWGLALIPPGFLGTVIGVVFGGLVGWLVFPAVAHGFVVSMSWILGRLSNLSLRDLVLAVSGLMAGLVLAFVVGSLLDGVPLVGPYVRVISAVVFGYLGLHLALQRRDEVTTVVSRVAGGPVSAHGKTLVGSKLIDTSAIIDGRIADICLAGFLEGPLLVPRSVLLELQRIADSSDALRRNRGRRGLDILKRLQKELATLQILEDTAGGPQVDEQLVKIARLRGASIVTTDFNLSKVAELQGISVLNVNKLAQALRLAVLPGEELTVQVTRDGKEAGQGVAYLEDGTMVVIEGGKRYIGETSDVIVTSVLQTSAGRMIFARPRSGEPAGSSSSERR